MLQPSEMADFRLNFEYCDKKKAQDGLSVLFDRKKVHNSNSFNKISSTSAQCSNLPRTW